MNNTPYKPNCPCCDHKFTLHDLMWMAQGDGWRRGLWALKPDGKNEWVDFRDYNASTMKPSNRFGGPQVIADIDGLIDAPAERVEWEYTDVPDLDFCDTETMEEISREAGNYDNRLANAAKKTEDTFNRIRALKPKPKPPLKTLFAIIVIGAVAVIVWVRA